MRAGTLVISNDLVGFVVNETDKTYDIFCKDKETRSIAKGNVHVIAEPSSLAYMYATRLNINGKH